MRLWLVQFMAGGHLVAGVITEAETFLAALDNCDDLGLIPEGTAVKDQEITVPVGEQWRDRLLTPEQIRTVLGDPGVPAPREGGQSDG